MLDESPDGVWFRCWGATSTEGDGGSKSVKPRWCSEESEGIYNNKLVKRRSDMRLSGLP
jgi:hypothetical protein